jgi:transposase
MTEDAPIPEKLRRILILRDVYDVSWREIARIVGLSHVCCIDWYNMFARGEMPGTARGRPRKAPCVCEHKRESKKRAMWISGGDQ